MQVITRAELLAAHCDVAGQLPFVVRCVLADSVYLFTFCKIFYIAGCYLFTKQAISGKSLLLSINLITAGVHNGRSPVIGLHGLQWPGHLYLGPLVVRASTCQ